MDAGWGSGCAYVGRCSHPPLKLRGGSRPLRFRMVIAGDLSGGDRRRSRGNETWIRMGRVWEKKMSGYANGIWERRTVDPRDHKSLKLNGRGEPSNPFELIPGRRTVKPVESLPGEENRQIRSSDSFVSWHTGRGEPSSPLNHYRARRTVKPVVLIHLFHGIPDRSLQPFSAESALGSSSSTWQQQQHQSRALTSVHYVLTPLNTSNLYY
uniref:Uncharacterized protein n=1 Tax=Ananas comosus var. bracteatus TaxID=296719 RepID=A0A6V7NWK2_ANACO|nr:unnamed protein product [Ananas comosus var. bracteatus]